MIREEQENNAYYFFDSMSDFTDYMRKIGNYYPMFSEEECSSHFKLENSRFKDSKDWKTFMNNLVYGTTPSKISDNPYKTDYYNRSFKMNKSIIGRPVVPRLLMNSPKPSRRLLKTYEKDYYPIFINCAEPGIIQKKDIFKYRNYIFSKIRLLISEGCSVGINWYAKSEFPNGKTISVAINLDSNSSNVSTTRLMYFITSSDVFRRGVFRIYETDLFSMDYCGLEGGYGNSTRDNSKKLEKEIDGILMHNLLSFNGSVERAIKDVDSKLLRR